MLPRKHLWMGYRCRCNVRGQRSCYQVVVAFTDIRNIEKKMTALVIPNAIGVSTATAKVSQQFG